MGLVEDNPDGKVAGSDPLGARAPLSDGANGDRKMTAARLSPATLYCTYS